MKKNIILLFLCIICISFTSDLQKKVIREKGFDIECYVSLKKQTKLRENKLYYWFKAGKIHNSMSNSGGFVLHDQYSKYFKSNQLAEQGKFDYGLKTGTWRTWYENGKIKHIENWRKGYKEGVFKVYDSLGEITLEGVYKNNLKYGQWLDYVKKDTIYYKKDSIFSEKPKSFIQRKLRKKDSLEKVQIKLDRINRRKADSIKRQIKKANKVIKKRNDSIKKAHLKLKAK